MSNAPTMYASARSQEAIGAAQAAADVFRCVRPATRDASRTCPADAIESCSTQRTRASRTESCCQRVAQIQINFSIHGDARLFCVDSFWAETTHSGKRRGLVHRKSVASRSLLPPLGLRKECRERIGPAIRLRLARGGGRAVRLCEHVQDPARCLRRLDRASCATSARRAVVTRCW